MTQSNPYTLGTTTVTVTSPFDTDEKVELTVTEQWNDNCLQYIGKADGVRIVRRFGIIDKEDGVYQTMCHLAMSWMQKKRGAYGSAWKNNLRLYEGWTTMQREIEKAVKK